MKVTEYQEKLFINRSPPIDHFFINTKDIPAAK